MNREKRVLVQNLIFNLPAVDQALDVLAQHQVTTYAMLVLQGRLFDPKLSSELYGNIDQASFLAGANAVLDALTTMPDMIRAIQEESKKS